MQAVIAFCHFCEGHGPRVLLTTHPIRNLPYGEGPSDAPDWPNDAPLSNIANTLPVSELRNPELIRGVANDRDARCSACTSIGDEYALLSADRKTKTSFITSQVSFDDSVAERVKYACFRSLSMEVGSPGDKTKRPPPKPGMEWMLQCPSSMANNKKESEKDGNVFFGDAEHGYTMSLTFRLDDSRARGFLRLYSFIVVSSHMQFILSNHDSLLAALLNMKHRLQRATARVYTREVYGGEEGSATSEGMRPENADRANMLPTGWLRKKVAINQSRGLPTLVGDENVWKRLHRQMLWTLRSESLRLYDGELEGLPTQDMLVIRELDTERVAELSLGSDNEHEKTMEQLDNLRRIARCLEEKRDGSLDTLLYHTIIGGQIVILGSSRSSIRSFLLALSNLLPIGCLRVNTQASVYAHPNKHNLLGLPIGTEIPEWAECLVVQMEGDGDKKEGDNLEGVSFCITRIPCSPSSLPSPLPSLLVRYKQLVVDEGVPENVLEATIRSTREQWLAKTKILYQLMRQPTQYSVNKMLISSRAAIRDRDVMFFWLEGLSKAYRSLSCPSSPH